MPAASRLAEAHRQGVKTIAGRLAAVLAASWRRLDVQDPQGSWRVAAGAAEGAFVAAQLAAAGMADEFVIAALAVQGSTTAAREVVDPVAFAGQAASGLALSDLLAIPASRFSRALQAGVPQQDARAAGEAALTMYARTEVADAARLATQVAMVSRGAAGYVRHVGARCCSRCAVLAGRWYRYSSSFQRHPGCSCSMLVAPRGTSGESPEELFRTGRITDLSAADRKAITLGADVAQVVNAKRGLYVAGGIEYTTAGTTRGVAGARILARRIAQAGGAPQGGVYATSAVSRREVIEATARYGPLMERGLPFSRRTPTGGQQVAPGYFRASVRPSVATIMQAGSRDEIARLLVSNGYTISRTREIAGRLAR